MISEFAKDLINKLVCDKEDRINFSQIIKHPWFFGIDFDIIRHTIPPNIPKVYKFVLYV